MSLKDLDQTVILCQFSGGSVRIYFVISSTAYTNKEVSFFRPFPPKRGKEKAMFMKERKVCVLEVKAEEQRLVFHYEEVEIRWLS
jgi:hypothetical protein